MANEDAENLEGQLVIDPAAEEVVVVHLTTVEQIITWVGFSDPAQLAMVVAELGDEIMDIGHLKEKDISELSDGYGKRTVTAGRIAFGL